MYYNADTEIYLDGKWLKAEGAGASYYSQTLHYGYGVCEGIRAYEVDGKPAIFKSIEHFERLKRSCEYLHIPFEYTIEELDAIAYELLERNGLTDAYIRPLYFLGDAMGLKPSTESHFLMATWKWGKLLGDSLLRMTLSPYERPNPKSVHVEAKACGHYVNSSLASHEAVSRGFDEALLCDPRGFVAEASSSNFFYEKDGTLYTAPLGNILPGITRETILELAREEGIPVSVSYFKPEEVYQADSAFVVGTAAEVAGIKSLDDYEFPLEWEQSLGFRLLNRYQKEVRKPQLKNTLTA